MNLADYNCQYDVKVPLWSEDYPVAHKDWIAHVFRSLPAMSEIDFLKIIMKESRGKVNPQWVKDVYKHETQMRELLRQLNKEVFNK